MVASGQCTGSANLMQFSLPSKPPYPMGIICSDLQMGNLRFLEAKHTEENMCSVAPDTEF